MGDVLNAIANLPDLFGQSSIGGLRLEQERTILETPLGAISLAMRTNRDAKTHEQDNKIARWASGAEHHFGNILTVVDFVLQDCQEYRNKTSKDVPKRQRLSLDLERLLIDTRSFLDFLLRLVLAIKPDNKGIITGKRAESYGRFAEFCTKAQGPIDLSRPLQLLREVTPWGLDVRKLRDGYIHHGHRVYRVSYGDKEYCIDLHFHRRLVSYPPPRAMPDLFYDASNPNNIIVVDVLLVYLIGPAIAIRNVVGACLYAELKAMRPHWRFHDGMGMPYQQGEFLFRIREWLSRNRGALAPTLYQRSYYALEKSQHNLAD